MLPFVSAGNGVCLLVCVVGLAGAAATDERLREADEALRKERRFSGEIPMKLRAVGAINLLTSADPGESVSADCASSNAPAWLPSLDLTLLRSRKASL